ncbi:hypothetical protein MA16_Dca027938 [Dendrobium catenatum]|uniref:Uncharacterized protein n=1 Tax=Dendrobium catenatum TaxID=906689 RepID=A0A2I0V6Q3_9ASPA|nr:hypothetical protein MA16_Dca027938 [Dendrobium catenatum]
MLLGTPHSLTTLRRKSLATSSVVQSAGAAMKVAYLLNLPTTTSILPYPSDFGRLEMKSKETLSHGLWGMGSGSNSPPGCC